MNQMIEIFIRTIIETFYITGVIIIIGFLLGALRNSSIRNLQKAFGRKAVMITGFIGTPIHEISHAIVAIIFGHKISEVKLFQAPDSNGVMGYVNHSYNKRNIYQQIGNFFIGIAPMFGGAISIILLMHFIVPDAYNQYMQILKSNFHVTSFTKTTVLGILSSYGGIIKTVFEIKNFTNPFFYLFLFVAICISSHISLSRADINGASRGLVVMFLIMLFLNLFDLSRYIVSIEVIRYNILLTGILIIAVFLSVITYLISLVLLQITKIGK